MIRETLAAADAYMAWARGMLPDHRPSRAELRLIAEGCGLIDQSNHNHVYVLSPRRG